MSLFNEKSLYSRLARKSAADWQIDVSKINIMWFIPIILMLLAPLSAIVSKDAFKLYTQEDGIAEILQVIFFFLAIVFASRLAIELKRNGERLLSLIFGVVVLGLFFIIGEEISWGQRIFDWEVSENLKELNRQKESNIHNLHSVEIFFKIGTFVIGCYGTIMPILLEKWSLLKQYKPTLRLFIPHYSLIPFFLPLMLWRAFRLFLDTDKETLDGIAKGLNFFVMEFSEVIELCFAIGVMLTLYYNYKKIVSEKVVDEHILVKMCRLI